MHVWLAIVCIHTYIHPYILQTHSHGWLFSDLSLNISIYLYALPPPTRRHIQPLLSVLEDEGDGDESELEEAEEGVMIPVTDDEASAPAVQLQTIYSGETSGPPPVPAEDDEEEAKAAMPVEQEDGDGAGAGAAPRQEQEQEADAPVVGCFSRVWSGLARARAGFVRVFGDLLTWPFFLFLVRAPPWHLFGRHGCHLSVRAAPSDNALHAT